MLGQAGNPGSAQFSAVTVTVHQHSFMLGKVGNYATYCRKSTYDTEPK